jgi:response regulator RpfG family c-di-GMP phosphodiesterase
MTETILLVDDDPNVLQACRRQFHGRFELQCATGAEAALALLKPAEPFAVVVSDMHMPGMDGVQFLAEIRRQSPDTVRIMLTGNATLQTSIDAVNNGHIFRFLIKPCAAEILGKTLEAGLTQYRLITAEKQLLSKTLSGAVKLTTEVLALTNPSAFGRSSRVQRLVQQLTVALRVPQAWQCVVAAMLSQVGCIAVPEAILAKVFANAPLSDDEARTFHSHPAVGRDLIANIPRLESVAEIIGYQDVRYGEGIAAGEPRGEAIPLGARILKVALDYDTLMTVHGDAQPALAEMLTRTTWYDPAVVLALRAIVAREDRRVVVTVPVPELSDHDILAEDVRTPSGLLLIARGQEVTPTLRALLQLHASTAGFQERVAMYVPLDVSPVAPDEDPTADASPPETIGVAT